MGRVTYMNESHHATLTAHTAPAHRALPPVMSHVWMSHVAHMNEACHVYD